MKKLKVTVTLAIILVIIGVGWGYVDKQLDIKASYEGAAYIKSFMSSSGKIQDVSNKIGMKDPNIDFKWFYEDKMVRIEFGYITMDFPIEEFLQPRCVTAMKNIGITYKLKTEGEGQKLILYYNGKEMDRWVE